MFPASENSRKQSENKEREIILTTRGDCLQKQTWDLFVLYRYRWLNIQTNHNMD